MADVVKEWAGGGQKGVHFFCPGCKEIHGIKYKPHGWMWNGDKVMPTFSPSVLVTGTVPLTDLEAAKVMAGEVIEPKPMRCHSFVRGGQIEFLSDCTHALAGRTVVLPPYKET